MDGTGGAIPYGYDIAPDGSFVIVEEEAAVVREIFANIANNGSTLYAEAKRLNDDGVLSPGVRYKGRERRYGASCLYVTIGYIVNRNAYSGVHEVSLDSGEIVKRPVPAIVSPGLQERAQAALAENKRYAGGKQRRDYLLRGLVWCAERGTAYAGTGTTSSNTTKRYYYYSCSRRKRRYDGRTNKLSCPHANAEWLEELVWSDVRRFLENPGEVLERVREQGVGDDTAELEARLESLRKRLATKSAEKDRYVRAFAQGHISEDELAVYVTDLNNQVEHLKLLITSAESDLATREDNRLAAESAASWLMTLRECVAELEADTEEARHKRRELARLLVERITVGSTEDGSIQVHITYRFGPPDEAETDGFSHGVSDTLLLV
jgi:site-specific DNA recombinase